MPLIPVMKSIDIGNLKMLLGKSKYFYPSLIMSNTSELLRNSDCSS
jgi:hypothetical protein